MILLAETTVSLSIAEIAAIFTGLAVIVGAYIHARILISGVRHDLDSHLLAENEKNQRLRELIDHIRG